MNKEGLYLLLPAHNSEKMDVLTFEFMPGLLPSPCFPIFLARTTFVLESLLEAKNPGQDAFWGNFVFNSSYS